MSKAEAPRRIGLIGCGRIAMPVVTAWREGLLPGWTIAGALARTPRDMGAIQATSDADSFFAAGYELIIEAAGPTALAQHGERSLAAAEVWTVSAAALADAALFDTLQSAAHRHGHRLRILPGAIAGLDGVSMASVDPHAAVQLEIELPPSSAPRALLFEGTVREAAQRFPDSVNVAAAAALAGPGMDATRIRVTTPGPVPQHHLSLSATSRFGALHASSEPLVGPGTHPVAASIVAALRRETQAIWVG